MNDIAVSRGARSVLADMADRYGMEPRNFEATVRATCFPVRKPEDIPSPEEFAAFLLVAKEYDLNPLLREIFAFRTKAGGIQPIVSVDGWMNLMNSHSQMNGLEFDDHLDKQGKLLAVTARIWRKDRDKPTVVTEYMEECFRDESPVWQRYPRRMLRHKAAIQAARYAFGFSGIVEPDEAERILDTSRMDYVQAKRVLAPSPDEQQRRVEYPSAMPVPQAMPPSETDVADDMTVIAQILKDEYDRAHHEANPVPEKPKRRPGRPPKVQPAPEAPSLQWEEGPEARAAALAKFPSQAAPAPQTSDEKVTRPEPDEPEPNDDMKMQKGAYAIDHGKGKVTRDKPEPKIVERAYDRYGEPTDFDPWKHLDDVVGRFRSAKTEEEVEEIYTIDCEPHKDDFQFPSDWEEIEEARRVALVRVKK